MEHAGRCAVLIGLSLLLSSCFQPVRHSARDEAFLAEKAAGNPWKKVAVLPFTGDPAFRRVAAEWFAFRLRGHGLFDVVDPALAEAGLRESGLRIGEEEFSVEGARKAGLALGADGVVSGTLKRGRPGAIPPEPPAAGATLVDAATGRRVAVSVQSSPRPSPDMQEHVAGSVDRVVEDLLPVLHAVAGKPWTLPPKEEHREPESPEPPR